MAKLIVAKQKTIDAALDVKVEISEKDQPIFAAMAPSEDREKAAKTFDERRAKLDALANRLTSDQIEAIHEALRILAAMDEDRARVINGAGFSKMDTTFGCELAARDRLSPRQAAAGMKLARKYRRQYSAQLYQRIIGGENDERDDAAA